MSTKALSSSSLYPIETLFPKEKYKKAGIPLVLHYLIAHGSKTKEIIEWAQSHIKYINYAQADYRRLTPLTICVLTQNKEVATFLLQKGADPTLADDQGWTPLHHAAVLGDNDILQMLIQKIGKEAARNLLNHEKGNYEDLQNLLMNKITKKEEVVCYYREKDQVSLCTSEQFHQKTKALFSHSMIISRQELINHWVRRPNSRTFSTDHATFFLQIYNDYLQHPPLLSFGIDDNSKCGYDVFAEQEIKAYHGVATYVGCLENAIKDETYTLEKINGAAIRNLGPMINDSFPNCIFSDVSYKGFTYQFIVAIRDIKQGEKLFFNYSITHPIKSYKTHFELNLSEFESYLATDFEKEIQIYSPFSPQEYKTGTDSLKKLFNTERLIYLFHTPSVWLYLLSRDLHEPFNKMKAMLDSKGLMGKSLILNENDCKGIQTYVNKCSEVSQELSRLQETQTDISTAVKRSLGELNESYSFKTVNYLLDEILKRFKEKIDSIEEWNQYILDLKKYADLLDSVYTYLKYDTFDLEIKKFIDQLEERFSSLPTDRQNQILIIVALYNVLLNKRSSKLEALLNSNLFGPLLKDVCDNLKKIIT